MVTHHLSDRRYEVDIEIKTKTTEHQVFRVICPQTGETLTGNFPIGITSTVQYGVNLAALAASLNTIGMVSLNHTHEILSDVFGVPLSTATIATMVKKCAHAVLKTVSDVKDAILGEPLIHFDETGIRVDGKLHWAHIASTKNVTYLSIAEKRGKKGMDAAGILPNYVGTGIHDCWGSYFKYDCIRHGLCCSHLLRELTAVTESYHQEWGQKLADLLLEMKDTKEKLISEGHCQAPERVWQKYNQKYDEILEDALAQNPLPEKDPNKKGRPKRGVVGSLVDRLLLRKHQWLLFFTDWSVPFSNNQAERDFRLFKLKQKVAGCFRTKEGADDFARITSFVSTARKRGISPFFAMKDALLNRPFSAW
jgi:transposase